MLRSDRFHRFERSEIEQSIASRFAQQVQANPTKLAAACGGATLTYAELDRAANRIAHALLARRGSDSEPVAVVLEQGVALLAAILGVLKAGKCYVPLERGHPRDRFAYMLRDSRAAVAVASDAALPLLAEIAPALDIVVEGRLDDGAPTDDPKLDIEPARPACIYYTTGSTGEPKGVVDSQRNVLHNVMRYTNALAVADDDRLTLLQSPSFSGAVSSMFAALLNGGASFPLDVRGSTPAALADAIERGGLTMYHSVPAIFRSVLRTGRQFPSMRIVRLEGDQASPADIDLFRRHFGPRCTLVNGLGTTETGIVRQFFIGHEGPLPRDVVPIGYPVEDMDVQVVDERGQPAAVGAVGDIAVRSRYLALGYWQRTTLSERAFVRDPLDPEARIYRTGDVGRMGADGCLEYLGRKDAVTKIRGVSVAIADVEAALAKLPSIQEAAVAVRTARGDRRLVAYLVPQPGAELDVSAIRARLAEAYPPPLIPSAFVTMPRLTLNENLKIDRGALPEPDGKRPPLGVPYRAARTLSETQLVQVFETLLQVAPVGVLDDFYDLGGDSLLATELILAVEADFGIRLPLSIMSVEATVEAIASAIDANVQRAALVALKSAGSKPPFYFVHGDYGGGGRFCRGIARNFDPDRPLFLLSPCGLDGNPAPPSIEDMAERHLQALRGQQPRGPYYLGGVCNGGLVALEMARKLTASGERVEQLIVFRATARNARFIRLRLAIERCARLLPLPVAWQRGAARHLRWFLEAWSARTPAERIGLVAEKLARLARELPMAAAAVVRRVAPGQPAPQRAAPLNEIYMKAVCDYIPPPYAGRVSVLWPAVEAGLESADEALVGWRRIAPSAKLEVVPGDHLTAVTVHAKGFASRLSAMLALE
jgi:amino acid adenylation domain-containing protein